MRGASSLMSSRRGALALSLSAMLKRASTRATTKASSSAVRPSPSRPQPKCFSRAANMSRSPGAPATIHSGAALALRLEPRLPHHLGFEPCLVAIELHRGDAVTPERLLPRPTGQRATSSPFLYRVHGGVRSYTNASAVRSSNCVASAVNSVMASVAASTKSLAFSVESPNTSCSRRCSP
jgi:hypothetical protein